MMVAFIMTTSRANCYPWTFWQQASSSLQFADRPVMDSAPRERYLETLVQRAETTPDPGRLDRASYVAEIVLSPTPPRVMTTSVVIHGGRDAHLAGRDGTAAYPWGEGTTAHISTLTPVHFTRRLRRSRPPYETLAARIVRSTTTCRRDPHCGRPLVPATTSSNCSATVHDFS